VASRVPNIPSLDATPNPQLSPDVLSGVLTDENGQTDDPEGSIQQSQDDFLVLARQRWQTIDNTETKLRTLQRRDLDFFASDQWDQKIKKQRTEDGRPCLTINRLPGYVRQLTNEMREGRPGIEITPVDSGADPDLAEALQGIIQHIEANSDADVAYQRAADAQVRIGRGWFRIVPEYADDTSFEQELRIKSVRNPNTVYFDAASQEMDGSDARYAFIVEDIPNPEYDLRFGKDTRESLEVFARSGEKFNQWMPEGKTRVAEYYYLEPKKRTLHALQNGMLVDDAQMNDPVFQQMVAEQQIDPTPVSTREVEGRQLCWALINGARILEGNETKTAGRKMPGRWIPIFPVYGEEIDNDGSVDWKGIIRDSIDSQRMSNYWKSAKTEAVALAPKAPYIAEEGQLESHEDEWQLANVKNLSVLRYKAKALDGHLIGPPQRNTAEPPIQAMAMLSLEAENDLRATSGFSYDVGAQEKRLEQSGRAIIARQKQGELGNSHFSAHQSIALRHAGRVLLDLIPKYYDTPRVKRILGRDGQQREVLIHAGNPEAAQRMAQAQGLAHLRIFDLSIGRYDVRVSAGISFASQRDQDQQTMTSIMQANPAMSNILGDLLFGTMNSPIAKRAASRLQKALPPELRDDAESAKPKIPPELQQQMEQAQALIDMLTKKVEEQTDALNSKTEDNQTKIRIAQIQADTAMSVAESKIVTQQTLALLDARMKAVDRLVEIDLARLNAEQAAPTGGGMSSPTEPTAPPPVPVPVPVEMPPMPEPANPSAVMGSSAPPGA